jgi:hypothetical protein
MGDFVLLKKEIRNEWRCKMGLFFEGVIAAIALLGGLCGFIYWVFQIMEKRLENKLDSVGSDVNRIANEMRDERISKDALYKFVLDNYRK